MILRYLKLLKKLKKTDLNTNITEIENKKTNITDFVTTTAFTQK